MCLPQRMKVAIAALALTAQLAFAGTPSAPPPQEPDESGLTSHGHYANKAGQEVHSPSASISGKVPTGSSAKCRDGTYSFSKHHSGTCSRHGGVAEWE
jgi:Protein of unknown function (DUF3761)